MSLITLGRELYGLFDRHQRRTFRRVALLGAFNAVLEAGAAILVFAMIDSLVNQSDSTKGRIAAIVNDVFGRGSGQRVTIILSVTAIIFYAIKTFSSVVEQVIQQQFLHRTGAEISTNVVSAYLRVPIHYHNLQNSGDLIRNAWNANEVLVRSTLLGAMSLLSEAFTVMALLAVLFVVSPSVTPILIVGLGGVVFAIYRVLRPRLTLWGQRTQELSANTFQTVNEVFGAMRETRILGRESFFIERYRATRRNLAEAFWRSAVANQTPRFFLETSFIWAVSVAILVFALRDAANPATVSLVGLYAYAGFRLLPSGNRIVTALTNLRYGESAVGIIAAALEVPQEVELASAPGEKLTLRREIELRDVSYSYPESSKETLHSISLTIKRGERVGIVGSSGAGKSTLVDILLGLMEPSAGSVLVDGSDIAGRRASWRRQVGCVSQTVFLLNESIQANVAFGLPTADQERIWAALEKAQLRSFVEALPDGMQTQLGERGVRVSGGQRQRIAVARALYLDPSVLILDEATSALDTGTEDELLAAVRALPGSLTTITVAHRLSTVENCDWLVLMQDGRVIATGSYSDLLARSPEFRQLVP